jgi:hypothetical protein
MAVRNPSMTLARAASKGSEVSKTSVMRPTRSDLVVPRPVTTRAGPDLPGVAELPGVTAELPELHPDASSPQMASPEMITPTRFTRVPF